MPNEKTNSDALRFYLSGATADGAVQTDPNLSIGNFRGSTPAEFMNWLALDPSGLLTNISIDFVSGSNGVGSGGITATGANDLSYGAPGGVFGAAVTILNGETKILEDGSDRNKFVRVTRITTASLAGTITLTLTDVFNDVVGFDNVSSAEATAGDIEYRCLAIKNESLSTVENIKAWIGQIGLQRISAGGQLPASGAGSITITTGDFDTDGWPSTGWCRIEDSAGTLREEVYYSSRTAMVLTVPAAGRARLGTTAGAGTATDNIFSVPGIRIAKEAPDSQPSGKFAVPADENTAPTGPTFNSGITSATGESIGSLLTLEIQGLWIQRDVPAGQSGQASILKQIELGFDSA